MLHFPSTITQQTKSKPNQFKCFLIHACFALQKHSGRNTLLNSIMNFTTISRIFCIKSICHSRNWKCAELYYTRICRLTIIIHTHTYTSEISGRNGNPMTVGIGVFPDFRWLVNSQSVNSAKEKIPLNSIPTPSKRIPRELYRNRSALSIRST